ncbi:2-methyl-aconitate isomerase [Lecanosticta acicola]|uniref:2-methyl-aconitate isomerase n=1 Tax=Lecanosticta acicola TaxID=111012 RepID=A0AAI9ECS7_9PEZI|nr:2-methyl-aconitate isomerase [Lecanosticta acicola]
MESHQDTVPAVYMRGGTSKALFLHEKDIPPQGPSRDRFLMRVMGSPDPMQIDGMGGTYPVTSKVAIIRPSRREDVDVDFIFAQVSVNERFVDYDAGCGNISSGVGPFAINEGLVRQKRLGSAAEGYTTQEVRIFQPLSTKKVLVAHVPIDAQGRFTAKGGYEIAGCPGSGSPILMDYRYTIGGGVDRGLIPTGKPLDTMELNGRTIEYSICDAAHIIAFARASDFGLKGDEHPKSINEDKELLDRVRAFRGKAAYSVGLCRDPSTVDKDSPILPMVALLSETPDPKAHIQSRLFLDNACHSAMAGAGATCTAACSRVRGSLVAAIMRPEALEKNVFHVHHPSGILPISIETGAPDEKGFPTFETLSFVRTARYLFKGDLFVPDDFDVSYNSDETHAHTTREA